MLVLRMFCEQELGNLFVTVQASSRRLLPVIDEMSQGREGAFLSTLPPKAGGMPHGPFSTHTVAFTSLLLSRCVEYRRIVHLTNVSQECTSGKHFKNMSNNNVLVECKSL